MKDLTNVRVELDEVRDLIAIAARETGDDPATIRRVRIRRRSLDARGRRPRHRKPSELSGGQCQRVAVARAIVREPDVRRVQRHERERVPKVT